MTESDKSETSRPPSAKQEEKVTRQQRLAEQLRANLRRRKAPPRQPKKDTSA